MLLLLVEVNAVAELASLGLGHALLREHDLRLVLLGVYVLDALLFVFAVCTAWDETRPVSRLTQVRAETKRSVGNVGRGPALVLDRVGREETFLGAWLALA